jgi:hypothetical protein
MIPGYWRCRCTIFLLLIDFFFLLSYKFVSDIVQSWRCLLFDRLDILVSAIHRFAKSSRLRLIMSFSYERLSGTVPDQLFAKLNFEHGAYLLFKCLPKYMILLLRVSRSVLLGILRFFLYFTIAFLKIS